VDALIQRIVQVAARLVAVGRSAGHPPEGTAATATRAIEARFAADVADRVMADVEPLRTGHRGDPPVAARLQRVAGGGAGARAGALRAAAERCGGVCDSHTSFQ
jgi:hypothetical protein